MWVAKVCLTQNNSFKPNKMNGFPKKLKTLIGLHYEQHYKRTYIYHT